MPETRVKLQRQIEQWIENNRRPVEFQRWAELAKADGYENVADHLAKTAENLELITQVFSALLTELDGPLPSQALEWTLTPNQIFC